MNRRNVIAILVAPLAKHKLATAAVRGEVVLYVGGTVKGLPEATEGKLDSQDEDKLIFSSDKGGFEIP